MKARPLKSKECPYGWAYDCEEGVVRAIGITPQAFEWFLAFSEQLGASVQRNCALGFYDEAGSCIHGVQFFNVQPNHLLGLAYNLFFPQKLHRAKVLIKSDTGWFQAYDLDLPTPKQFYDWPFAQDDLPGFQLDPASNLYRSARALWSFKPHAPTKKSKKRTQRKSESTKTHSSSVSQLQMGGL